MRPQDNTNSRPQKNATVSQPNSQQHQSFDLATGLLHSWNRCATSKLISGQEKVSQSQPILAGSRCCSKLLMCHTLQQATHHRAQLHTPQHAAQHTVVRQQPWTSPSCQQYPLQEAAIQDKAVPLQTGPVLAAHLQHLAQPYRCCRHLQHRAITALDTGNGEEVGGQWMHH